VNGSTLERPDVAAYLDAVRSRLSDLPAEERDDLADVEASLLESGEPPALSPQEFAASQSSLLNSLRAWLASERAASLAATARELAPIWWLARAYVAVAVVAIWGGLGGGRSGRTPQTRSRSTRPSCPSSPRRRSPSGSAFAGAGPARAGGSPWL
jgi:hypothetical protein